MTLSGTVSSKQAGENVTILAQPAGQPASSTQVTTTSGGAWSLQVQPQANTTYRAQFEGASSTAAAVAVRPRITLEKVGRDRFLAVVVAARSMAGKTVELTRRTGNAGWVTIGQQQLQSIARTNTTVVATFTSGVRLGTKLRVFMRAAETSPDYRTGSEVRRSLTVLKTRGSDHTPEVREFRIGTDGLTLGDAVEAGRGEHLRDAVSHRAAADDGDLADVRARLDGGLRGRRRQPMRSTASATALPPPRHSVASPVFPPRASSA